MVCPSCRAAVEAGRAVCPACGARIWSPVAPTVPVPLIGSPPEPAPPAASWPPPITAPVPVTQELEQELPIVAHEGPAWQVDIGLPPRTPSDTSPLPLVPAPVAVGDDVAVGRRSSIAVVAVGIITAVLAAAGAFTDVGTVRVTGPLVPSVTWQVDDMASNLLVATCLGAGLVLFGALLALVRRPHGARLPLGLAGGAGLALAGLACHVIGQTIDAFDEVKTLLVRSGQSYTLRTTMEIGFWLLGAAGVLGLALFVLALVALRRSPVVGSTRAMVAAAVVGTVGSIAAAIGPIIPEHGASFVDQFYNDGTPPLTSILRIAVLVLLLLGGAIGFLARRPWGLALVTGSAAIALWQTVSTLLEFGGRPMGLAGGNPTTINELIHEPHLVTSLGLALMVLALLVGYTAALARRTAAAAT